MLDIRHMTAYIRHMTDTAVHILSHYQQPADLPDGEASRVAKLLSLKSPDSVGDVQLAEQIAEGLGKTSMLAMAELFRVTFGKDALYAVVSEPTWRRALKGKGLAREQSERLYELSRVLDHTARTFHGDVGRIQRFLTRPNMLLEGRTPFEVARLSSAGSQAVVNLLAQADAGVAV